jgi:uncharacterized protein YkwD
MAVLVVLACLVPTAAARADSIRTTLLGELNRVRAHAHLGALRLDRRMNGTASAYSRHLARAGRVGHGGWSARVARSASNPSATGEVIGWLAPGAARGEAPAIVQAWLSSPGHRHVLLDGAFRRIGVGRAVGSLFGTTSAIYTVDFASAR